MVDMKELKNCPFCDSKSSANIYREQDGKKFWDIRCNNDECNFIVECKGGYPTRGMAEEAWNTRSADTQIESLAAQLSARNDDMAFIKRWVQRVHDKETSLEEFYSVLRYYTPLKPVEAALNQQEEKI